MYMFQKLYTRVGDFNPQMFLERVMKTYFVVDKIIRIQVSSDKTEDCPQVAYDLV